MISILTPTRNSPTEFKSMVDSLVKTCSNKSLVEILVKIDDDTDDIKYVESTLKRSGFKYTILSSPRGRGILDIPKYVDELFKISIGLIVWGIADDIIITTGDWVKDLMSTRDRIQDNIYIAYPKYASKMSQARNNKFRGSGNGTPVLSREMYNKLSDYGILDIPFDCYIRGISNAVPDRTFYINVYTVQKVSNRKKITIVKKKLSKKNYDKIVENIGLCSTRRSEKKRKRNV